MDTPNQPVKVQFYIVQNGRKKWLGTLIADDNRPDITSSYPELGAAHGFYVTFGTDISGSAEIEVYGVNEKGEEEEEILLDTPKAVVIQKEKAVSDSPADV